MSKKLSPHAACAAAIRKHVVGLNLPVKPRVTSDSFAGGNSVRVSFVDLPPRFHDIVRKELDQYQYGDFNGMTDMYEYRASRPDIPRVKYVSIDNSMSDHMRQTVYEYLCGTLKGMENMPRNYADMRGDTYLKDHDIYLSTLIWQTFTGAALDFWEKEKTQAA